MQDEIKDILLKQIEQFFLEGDSPTLTSHTGKKKKKILPAEWFQGSQRFSNISAWFKGFFKKFTKNETLSLLFLNYLQNISE